MGLGHSIAFVDIVLSGPLLVNSMQMQYADSNPADTILFGKWHRSTPARCRTGSSCSGSVAVAISRNGEVYRKPTCFIPVREGRCGRC